MELVQESDAQAEAIERKYVALGERISEALEYEFGLYEGSRYQQVGIVAIDTAEVIDATKDAVAAQVVFGALAVLTNMPLYRQGDINDGRNRTVLYARSGLIDGTIPTLQAVGNSVGLTRERIRQIESRQFHLLKRAVRQSGRGIIRH